MKTIYNRPFTLDELAEYAEKQRKKLYREYARYLCSAAGIGPEEHFIGPYLHEQRCEDNLDATVRWLKTHLADTDILQCDLDLPDCINAFRIELRNKIPTEYWGDQA